MADFALQFDGSQNYLDLGTMGSFGSSLGSGAYWKFNIKTTSTSAGQFGVINGAATACNLIWLNYNQAGTATPNKISMLLRDDNNLSLGAGMTNTFNFTDGQVHTVEVIITPSTNTVVIKIDGISQAITYNVQQTPATFSNYNKSFFLGARNDTAAINQFYACTLDDVLLGVSASNIFGNYHMNEGSGTTTADSSGNSNTGTLTGSPLPTWVAGLYPPGYPSWASQSISQPIFFDTSMSV